MNVPMEADKNVLHIPQVLLLKQFAYIYNKNTSA